MPETFQKIFLTPRGDRGDRGPGGARGDSFLKIYILCNFGDISSNLSCDRCQKPPKIILTSWEARGASGGSWGTSFVKICILGILGDISSNMSWDRCSLSLPHTTHSGCRGLSGGQKIRIFIEKYYNNSQITKFYMRIWLGIHLSWKICPNMIVK